MIKEIDGKKYELVDVEISVCGRCCFKPSSIKCKETFPIHCGEESYWKEVKE